MAERDLELRLPAKSAPFAEAFQRPANIPAPDTRRYQRRDPASPSRRGDFGISANEDAGRLAAAHTHAYGVEINARAWCSASLALI